MPALKTLIRAAPVIAKQAAKLVVCRHKTDWLFVGESGEWSINEDGRQTLGVLRTHGLSVSQIKYAALAKATILHFGSLNSYKPRHERRYRALSSTHDVVTCFHGNFGLSAEMDRQLRRILENHDEISTLVLSNRTMQKRFIKWGFPPGKISVIPVGVDVRAFSQRSTDDCETDLKKALMLPSDRFIIGSFQKDGNGWGEGNDPKLIKGPDLFCDTVIRLARRFPIHVLLTGPARGYVKQRLCEANITFTHRYLNSVDELPAFYRACDIYLMTSREEGGPKSIPECMASSTPIVATRTGVVPDVEEDYPHGWFADVGDVDALFSQAIDALTNEAKRALYRSTSREYASRFSWSTIGLKHYQIYQRLIDEV